MEKSLSPSLNTSSSILNEQSAPSKDEVNENVKELFDDLQRWINNHQTSDGAYKQDLVFKFKRSSYVKKADGSISTFIKCPIRSCTKGYLMSFKSYRNKYRHRMKPEPPNAKAANNAKSRWQLSSITKHLQQSHAFASLTKNTDTETHISSFDALIDDANDNSNYSFNSSVSSDAVVMSTIAIDAATIIDTAIPPVAQPNPRKRQISRFQKKVYRGTTIFRKSALLFLFLLFW
ncbi:hypothetical protein Bhyg_03166 [Pseudolycoriella hygida]|uniref:Uncharacterized protein n=1 Tax=Pseudolycoriella hygida TaxID=35572 RepID=A0A9Q0NEE2_9DIPT|nr:hypothetical protein Bhyg_03166 [Pseudolycoriella hygida]